MEKRKMDKFKSLALLTAFILAFILCECLLFHIHSFIVIGGIALIALRVMEGVAAIGAVIETIELGFDVDIKNKIKQISDVIWKKVFPN